MMRLLERAAEAFTGDGGSVEAERAHGELLKKIGELTVERDFLARGWRRSGLTSPEFCEGKDFTPGGLQNMASVLGKRATAAPVRLARLVRVPSAAPRAIEEPVVLEIGAVKIQVRRGASLEALATVLWAGAHRPMSSGPTALETSTSDCGHLLRVDALPPGHLLHQLQPDGIGWVGARRGNHLGRHPPAGVGRDQLVLEALLARRVEGGAFLLTSGQR